MSGSNSCDMDYTRRIPPEILTEIFLYASVCADDIFEPHDPPWLLGRICTRWRVLALSIPSLWCSLMIVASRVEILLPSSSLVPLISAYIERSAQLPLKLTLDPQWSRNIPPLLDLFLSPLISKRWEDVALFGLIEGTALAHRKQYILPALESGDFACLKTLRFERCHLMGKPSTIISLPNLTSLTLVSSPTEILKCLSTPHLEHLRLESSPCDLFLEHVRSFLRRSDYSLTRLGWVNTQIEDVKLLNLLRIFPNLTELDLCCANSRTGTISDAFLAGLHSRKGVVPKLKCLSLGGHIYGSPDGLVDLLESRSQEYLGSDETACSPLLLCPVISVQTIRCAIAVTLARPDR
ncbi:hypothetical protein B0H14DRAFT_618644 [Mycena olivaceomarginata]|nr:hypothetical protein B0H14DRAFT_618644 [Mycena olivaceomarginata]